MAYTLIGSQTSPFVRRTRMLLENIPYEFKELNIFEAEDAEKLHRVNPVHQVPVLIDGDKTIWDSRIIFQYLNEKHHFEKMDWEKENLLTAIDGALTAGVVLLLSKRSGIDVDAPLMYFDRQKERMNSILDFFKPLLQEPKCQEWNILTMSLYCFLDWATFRGLINLEGRPDCLRFLKLHAGRPIVQKTQIPKT